MSSSRDAKDPPEPREPSRGDDDAPPPADRGVARLDDTVAPPEPDSLDGGLDGALAAAYRPKSSIGRSVLERIEALHGVESRILLRDESKTSSPLTLRREGHQRAQDDSRYQVIGEIARGGIGIVYRGLDTDLNRDVALKVLRLEYRERRDVVQRFVEEAQVGGQLQHPGIVPIYGMGLQPDGRPSFAMKLIKGRTLAALLEVGSDGTDLQAVFEQVVQTVAYAHSRGVIHRDLKPANVMVGAFGEVQVVDWGFAKVLGNAEPEPMPGRTMIATVRSGREGSQSVAGSVMGTPAYMPPEQALGQIEDLDERCDVFALGAMLCEILTGEPIYTGDPRDQLVAAAQARLDGALQRLAACEAPEGLKQIVRACLEPLRSARPRDAGVVAQRLAEHFAGVEERARAAEVAAACARNDALLSAAQRRRSLALAGMAMLAVGTLGGGWLYLEATRAARESAARPRIDAALTAVAELRARSQWDEALGAARQAVRIADVEGADGTQARAVLEHVEQEASASLAARRATAADEALLTELDKLRSNHGETLGPNAAQATDAAYSAAFAQRFETLEAGAAHMASSPQAAVFAGHLAFWCWLQQSELQGARSQPLRDLALRIDPEHASLRESWIDGDTASLHALVADDAPEVPPMIAAEIAQVLIHSGEHQLAIPWLRRQLLTHGDDAALHLRMAEACRRADDAREAIDQATAAVALRPQNALAWSSLARSYGAAKDHGQALQAGERALSLDPQDGEAARLVAESRAALGQPGEVPQRPEDASLRSGDAVAVAPTPSEQRAVNLDATIARLAAGEQVDVSAEASAELAERCNETGRPELAVVLWQRAFDRQPSLARDPRQAHRYHAARSAVLAGPATHAQALSWLTEELAALRREAGERPADVARALQLWQRDPDLAAVRDGGQLSPEFQVFWKNVTEQLAELQK